MKKKIVIIGTLDTKSDQLLYLKEKIESNGHEALLMDISMGGRPSYQAEISPKEIAALGGKDLDDIVNSKDRSMAVHTMTVGSQQKALDLLSRGELHGIVAMGGATIALAGSRVMEKVPFGVPKVIGTPAAMPVYISRWFGAMDLAVIQMIMEVAGMNDLVKNEIAKVAGAISGMVEKAFDYTELKLSYPSIAVTQLGFSDQCAKNVEGLLEEKGYNVFPFHAQGISDRAMDRLISQGFFDGVIEIVPAGLVEEKYKGNRAAGMERLDAGLERGLPQVWAPCCLNITGAGITRTNREKYLASGKVYEIDEIRAMARFPRDELLTGARMYAGKINRARGPLKMVIPLRGWSSLDREGTVLYDPEEDQLFIDELKKHLKPGVIEFEEVDCNLEDMGTAEALVNSLDRYMKKKNT